MTIERADWRDILTVLHESYRIWSPGLSKDEYYEHISRQINHPWARRNFKFFVLKEKNTIVASCKLYKVEISARGRTYKCAGLGAIFTMPAARAQGFGSKLVSEAIDYCFNREYDALFLFSDIDPNFYSRFGFCEMGAADFSFHLPRSQPVGEYTKPAATFVEAYDVSTMVSIYSKWLRSQPFGFQRSNYYLDYKLSRERYLAEHSTLAWPRLEITYALENGMHTGYALTERGGHNVRVLEIIGSESARRQLWNRLVAQGMTERMHKIRGWESVVKDLYPGFKIQSVLDDELSCNYAFPALNSSARTWGRPMFLSLINELEDLDEFFPCPILELDHL